MPWVIAVRFNSVVNLNGILGLRRVKQDLP